MAEEQWGIDDTLDFPQAPVNMSSVRIRHLNYFFENIYRTK